MATDWGRIGAGVATAGQSELWRAGANALLSSGGKGGSTTQVPLVTPEQQKAMSDLSAFSQTGKFGEFQAGAQVPLNYGDYNATGLENQGQSQLQDLLRGGIPDQYRLGDQALQGFLSTNPADVSAQFDPFRAQVERQMREADTNLKRGAGFAGNLYSTDTIRKLGDVQARGNENLTSQLANLTNQSLDRRLQAIPLAYQSAQAQQAAKLDQIGAAHQYGALTRQLNDASIKARDTELLRRRQELQLPIQAATSLAGGNVQFGVPSVQNPSPYADLLGLVGQIGGQYASGYAGAAGRRAGAGTVPGKPSSSLPGYANYQPTPAFDANAWNVPVQ